MVATFHLLMLTLDVAALWFLHHRSRSPPGSHLGRRARPYALATVVAASGFGGALIALFLAAIHGHGAFAIFGLWSLLLFVHTPALLAGAAWILRRSHPGAAGAALSGSVSLVLVGIYATWIEPRWLEVSRVEISSAKISRPLRLAVIADLQTDSIGDYERQALTAVMAEKPDLIVMPGDYLQVYGPRRHAVVAEKFRRLLREIDFGAPLGAYALEGDTEGRGWQSLFAGTQVTATDGRTTIDAGGLKLTMLSARESRIPALGIATTNTFHVVAGHAPDFALGDVAADLLLAGHTHGGQVRLPFFGPIVTLSAVPRSWAAGVTDLGDDRTLIVSRGVGMERGRAPRIRFLCRPEVVIVDLLPSA